jgi:HEAT repeat protein
MKQEINPGLNYVTYGADLGEEALVQAFEESADPGVKIYSIVFMGKMKDLKFMPLFVRALHDRDKQVRLQATIAIAALGEPAVPELLILLLDDDWKVRYRAAEALGMIKSHYSIIPLVNALNDQNDHVRYMAAKALGETGDSSATEPLIRRLKDENDYVRRITVISLKKTGGHAGIVAIRGAFEDETSEQVRNAMKDALGEGNTT